jgi:hypothetical protein
VRGIASSALARLEGQLEQVFTLESVPLTENLVSSLKYKMIGGALLGVLGLVPQSLILLKECHGVSFEDLMRKNHSLSYKNFGVSLLNHLILDRMLGVAQDSEDIAYAVDVEAAWQGIKEKKYQLAFLLSSPPPEIIKTVADAKDRMPRKSTYFHPKLPTGLIINPLA